MSIKLQLPQLTDLRPRLTVIGVGGAGCNAVNNMIAAGLHGVEFAVANTDAQALAASSAEHRIQLGARLTEGLGAGSKPEVGEAAAEESIDEIRAQISGSHMVFVAAGMGGGTGTGAAAVIARCAREQGILTVGVVTRPFQFEGARRARIADAGVEELSKYVDTLIVIPNQNLFRIATEKTTFEEAFVLADQVLYSGVACIVDLIIKEGLINLDFADVRTVMSGMGTAMMGTGEAAGERRAIMAAEEAISNPLLDEVTLNGAKGLLLSITGGRDLTLYEVDEAASRVRQEVDPEANIIVGATFDDSLGDRVRVSIVASGMTRSSSAKPSPARAAQPTAAAPAVPPPVPETYNRAFTPPPVFERETPRGAGDLSQRISGMMQAGPLAPEAQVHEPSRAPAGPPSPEPVQVPVQAPAQSSWQAPGNVSIDEGLPPQFTQPAPVRPQPQAMPPSHSVVETTFAPQPPVDVRRTNSRVPDISEFPAVGQREYRARMQPQDGRHEPEARGWFDRFTGRRRSDEASARNDSPAATRNEPAVARSSRGPDTQAGSAHQPSGRDQDFPMFFKRERK